MGKVRIISGTFRGRTVETPEGEGTRPLLARLRKSLADLLRPRLSAARILDLFGGSGAIAFELLSNGALHAVVVEMDAAAAEVIKKNAAVLGAHVEVLTGDALRVVPTLSSRGQVFDVVIVAPPYGHGLQARAVEAVAEAGVLTPHGVVVVQRDQREAAVECRDFRLDDSRRYGRTVFDFYLLDSH